MDESCNELRDDFVELKTIASASLERIGLFLATLSNKRPYFEEATYSYLAAQVQSLSRSYETLVAEMDDELRGISPGTVAGHVTKKREAADLLRTLQSVLGSLLSAGAWQSPSFDHSVAAQAGIEGGLIEGSKNDYKRDVHLDEQEYAARFVKEYVDQGFRLEPKAFVMNSGMAAVTTVLTSLMSAVKRDALVVAGKNSYFQNKWVLECVCKDRLEYVDEFDMRAMLNTIAEKKPAVVFLDTVCGAEMLPMPDIRFLLKELPRVLPRTATLVLDNTGLGTTFQPLKHLFPQPFGPRILVIESLLKYHQFGFDRTNAGIVWAPLGSTQGIFEARMHLGTNISDIAVHMLPRPNRALLDKRLARIGRNALFLAHALSSRAETGKGPVNRVVYPGLESYPGYSWTKDMPFHGGFITLVFRDKYATVSFYDSFVSRTMDIAKKYKVPLIGGTSFGFNTTRIYVTARYATNITKPFVRISVGTETRYEIEKIASVLTEALDQ